MNFIYYCILLYIISFYIIHKIRYYLSQLRDSLYIYIFFRKRKQENKRKQLKQCKSCEVIQIRTYRTSINNISTISMIWSNCTHEYLLQGIDRLIGHRYPINFSDLVTHVKGRLSVYHTTVHNSCYHTFSIFVHF